MPRKFIIGVFLLLTTSTATFALYWVYQVDRTLCNGCANCIPWCPESAISMVGPDAWIDPGICTECGECLYHCPRGAIFKIWYTGVEEAEISPLPVLAPNPSTGFVSITGLCDGQSVSVFDTSGRLLCSSVSSGDDICMNLPGSHTGLYILLVDGIPVLTFTVIR